MKKGIFQHDNPYYRNLTDTTKVQIQLKVYRFIEREWKNDLYPVASMSIRQIRASNFRAPLDKVVITGTPRTDIFFRNQIEKVPISDVLENFRNKGLKIGIYMPTRAKISC